MAQERLQNFVRLVLPKRDETHTETRAKTKFRTDAHTHTHTFATAEQAQPSFLTVPLPRHWSHNSPAGGMWRRLPKVSSCFFGRVVSQKTLCQHTPRRCSRSRALYTQCGICLLGKPISTDAGCKHSGGGPIHPSEGLEENPCLNES